MSRRIHKLIQVNLSVTRYTESLHYLATRSGIYKTQEVLAARYFVRLRQDIQDDMSTVWIWTIEEDY